MAVPTRAGPWSDDERARLVALAADGEWLYGIAQALGRGVADVTDEADRLSVIIRPLKLSRRDEWAKRC